MQTLLVATMLALCKIYTPDQLSKGCYDVINYMVNCVIKSDKDLKEKTIKECADEFSKGQRYKEKG